MASSLKIILIVIDNEHKEKFSTRENNQYRERS